MMSGAEPAAELIRVHDLEIDPARASQRLQQQPALVERAARDPEFLSFQRLDAGERRFGAKELDHVDA